MDTHGLTHASPYFGFCLPSPSRACVCASQSSVLMLPWTPKSTLEKEKVLCPFPQKLCFCQGQPWRGTAPGLSSLPLRPAGSTGMVTISIADLTSLWEPSVLQRPLGAELDVS
jgi:hypothetical protein